jgi:hypothetical protein
MAIQTSFPKIADQILSFNKNVVDILSKIDSVVKTTEPSISIQVFDNEGILRNYTIPSFTNLKAEIDRLNNNINSLYNIDSAGALIETSNQNRFKKIITVDLNREPTSVDSLGGVSTFKTSPNWFFDALVDPMMSVEFDLIGKIQNNVRKCQIRRYIIDFAKDVDGNLTNLGQSALNSFNELWRGNSNIIVEEFLNWHQTTPGVVEPLNPKYDEQIFDLEPNNLLFDGQFSVLRIQEDRINRKLWYVLNTLSYALVEDGSERKLEIDDEVIINSERTSTRYRIIEISNSESYPRVRFERVEGIEPISVGIGTLKIYSPVVYTKKVRVSIGYNERNVIFLKPINTDNHLLAKDWSLGTGFYTNDLRLDSTSTVNGLSMEQFYIDYVYDYGEVLQDLVAKKTPNKLAGTPVAPTLSAANFKVVQINKHLTDTPDGNLIKQKHNYQLTLKSEMQQIEQAIIDRNKKVKITKFKSDAERKQSELEVKNLIDKKDSRSKLFSSVNQEIITLTKNPRNKVEPKFRVRGFWAMPEAIVTRGTKPQEIVQFRIQYRYVSKDGRETPVETYSLTNTQRRASFSNWNEFKTDARKRNYDPQTGEYFWQIEDVESADTPNINQLDLPIQSNERIEFRIKSISEVGWPESPVESDWSEVLGIDFPEDLNNVLNENDFILQEASKEDLKVSMQNELSAKGIDEHLSDSLVVNNKIFHHESTKILSGFRDENGVALDMFEYLKKMEDRIRGLEEKIRRAKGELQIVILRNNIETIVKNGSETVFSIECEDYLEPYTAQGVPTGRVYENNIYTVKDFVIKIRNAATESPLGLLSNRTYLQNSGVYNTTAPQTFWVNAQDELLTSELTGATRTQLNNQFVWMVNYDSVTENAVAKLSENIGNTFISNNNNSITPVLSSTEYNIGYNETTLLNFVGNNKSLLDPQKWIDRTVSVASTTKLLTSIHPVVKDLETIVENNSDKVKVVDAGDRNSVIIPLNIYFKMNALDTNQRGLNYKYIVLNPEKVSTGRTPTVKHIKKVKFFLENESENRPFTFTLKFNINRNKVIVKKTASPVNSSTL